MKTIATKTMLVIILIGVTAATTVFVRVPTPATAGYINLGDIMVIFCGLFLGGRWGAIAGGIGSALGDFIGGAFIYIPVTLVIKGLEAWVAGTLGKKHWLWLALAVAVMFFGYFIAEIFLPGMGFSAALSSLPFNVVQGITGGLGGYFLYKSVMLALPDYPNTNEKE